MMPRTIIYRFILVILAIWLVRCLLSGSISIYAFLWWNILLAVMPLIIERGFPIAKRRLSGTLRKITNGLLAISWLLFIPNAYYILTDFMHLNPIALVNERNDGSQHAIDYVKGDAIYMLDSLLLFSATAFGALVGGMALFHGYVYIRKHLSQRMAIVTMSVLFFLVAVGVYIGRYGRWNSWDALWQPWTVAHDLIVSLGDPTNLRRFVIVIVTICILQLLSVWYVRAHQKELS